MNNIRLKIKKIKESRLTEEQKLFYDFLNKMSHRPDSDNKYKEEWFYDHYGHIFSHDKSLNRIKVYTHEHEWKNLRRSIYSLLNSNDLVNNFLENEIKNYFNCKDVQFFYNTYIEKQRREWNEKWGESYNEVLNR